MKKALQDAMLTVQLIDQAVQAMRNILHAEAVGSPDEEVQRLHLLAQSVVEALPDYEGLHEGLHKTLH